MKGRKRILLTSGAIIALVALFSECMDFKGSESDTRGEAYAGAATCVKCHKEVYASYSHNAHFQTTQPVSPANTGKNRQPFILNEELRIAVEDRDSGLYQVGYFNRKEVIAKRFDIAFGSGEKARTYGYWQGKKLFQLPLSWFSSVHAWANSPGFSAHRMNFERAIVSRCFQCHSSGIGMRRVQTGALEITEELDKKSLIYGIDCERCHGPAKAHADFHLDNPGVKKARYILPYKALTRQQRLDACGVCHTGNDQQVIKPTFTFKPGDNLSDYYEPEFTSYAVQQADVHGKQNQSLAESRCFIKSAVMDCSSCHAIHENIKGNMAVYSQRCVACHARPNHAKLPAKVKAVLNTNCIDCHMPAEPSRVITFRTAGNSGITPYLLRSHRIAIYPEIRAN